MPDTLSAGVVYTLTTNTIYSLPPRVVRVTASAALEVSNDNSSWAALANSTTGAECGSAFIRCTTAAAIVAVKYLA